MTVNQHQFLTPAAEKSDLLVGNERLVDANHVACAVLGLSASVQMAQFLSVTREPDVLDMAYDMGGALMGLAAAKLVLRMRRPSAKPA